jgi:hypothetical protein
LRWDEIANSLDLGCIGGYTWKLTIEGGAASLDSVLDSPLRWDKAEDPNLEMPAGHFLPIPYAGLAIKFDESLILRMDFTGPLDIAD